MMVLVCGPALKLPSFTVLSEALHRAGAPSGAAECHGLLCGLLSRHAQFDEGQWLAHVLDDAPGEEPPDEASHACRALLQRLVVATANQLQSVDCRFEILLPADSETLAVRSRALGQWCAGFLAGVGLGGDAGWRRLPPDSQEILGDMTEITCIDAPSGEEDDDEQGNEAAYAELVEYLRVSALIVREELQDCNVAQGGEQEGC